MSDNLTHIHYAIRDNEPVPYVGTEVSTLCGLHRPYEEDVTKPVCVFCFKAITKIREGESLINGAMVLQIAAEVRRQIEDGAEE